MNCNANKSIECTVSQCAHHCNTANYCSLDKILVGTHEANPSMDCTVHQCANHCQDANYCALDRILVGTHEGNPTMDQCTDCKSFRQK